MRFFEEFKKGLWRENPALVQVLGTCPTLAVTTKALFGFSMGMATLFVLVCSSVAVSVVRKIVPDQVRIAVFTVIIATFVTAADYFLRANFYDISKALGPYVPLIVVNCIILGRAEAYASKNGVFNSFLDALGMGLGFTGALMVIGSIREILGSGAIFGHRIAPEHFTNWVVMVLPAGAFITFGLVVGLFNLINIKMRKNR